MPRFLATALLLGAVFTAGNASAAAGGTVRVECPVFGATVSVDGRELGLVPIDAFQVPFGPHTVTVTRRGLIAFRQQIVVKPGPPLVVNAVPAQAKALLTIQTPVKGAEVLVDGAVVGTTPVFEVPIEPGKHRLFIRRAGLQPYQETFLIGPHREYIAKPSLKNANGSVAGGLFDDDLELGSSKPAMAAKSAGADLDLDFDDAPAPAPKPVAVAAAPPPAPPADAFALDLDFDDLPPLPDVDDAPKPAVVAAKPAAKPAVAASKPAIAAPKPAVATKPVPAPTTVVAATSAPQPSEPIAAFAADPVAAEQVRVAQDPPQPFYKKKWVWAATAVVVAAAIAVPVATGQTGGYREVRDPASACGDCLVVMNR